MLMPNTKDVKTIHRLLQATLLVAQKDLEWSRSRQNQIANLLQSFVIPTVALAVDSKEVEITI